MEYTAHQICCGHKIEWNWIKKHQFLHKLKIHSIKEKTTHNSKSNWKEINVRSTFRKLWHFLALSILFDFEFNFRSLSSSWLRWYFEAKSHLVENTSLQKQQGSVNSVSVNSSWNKTDSIILLQSLPALTFTTNLFENSFLYEMLIYTQYLQGCYTFDFPFLI